MGDDSQESPQASSYCMIDTPGKKKPLTREEDLPSAEESEEKKAKGGKRRREKHEQKEEQKEEQKTNKKKIRKAYK